jgi:hypothetical protein
VDQVLSTPDTPRRSRATRCVSPRAAGSWSALVGAPAPVAPLGRRGVRGRESTTTSSPEARRVHLPRIAAAWRKPAGGGSRRTPAAGFDNERIYAVCAAVLPEIDAESGSGLRPGAIPPGQPGSSTG